jgi:hypothetical protein
VLTSHEGQIILLQHSEDKGFTAILRQTHHTAPGVLACPLTLGYVCNGKTVLTKPQPPEFH